MIETLLAALTVGALLGGWTVRRHFAIMDVDGISMEPTLHSGDRVLVRRCKSGQVRAGQIVVVERPDRSTGWSGGRRGDGRVRSGSRDWYVKRAVAVAGQPVPAAVAEQCRLLPGGLVPADSFLLLGDNPRSEDSKQWGFCPGDRLFGIVVRKVEKD